MYMCVQLCAYAFVYADECTPRILQGHSCIIINVNRYMQMHINIYIYIYIYIYMYLYIYIHTHIYLSTCI